MSARDLYELRYDGCPWDRLPPNARANWERIAVERAERIVMSHLRELDVEYDGVKLRDLLARDLERAPPTWTRSQLDAVERYRARLQIDSALELEP